MIIQSLAKLKILSEEELKSFKYCKSFGIQLNLSKKMPKRGRNTQKLICFFVIVLLNQFSTISFFHSAHPDPLTLYIAKNLQPQKINCYKVGFIKWLLTIYFRKY